ncbi:MAG: hsp70 nucleotide exchange factor fes1 [Caeruleum heppii]|nr:MAG: hsp70 nucleotide exchange factor fes1 [Caeruleum heppii]
MDKNLNQLLKWSIENSSTSNTTDQAPNGTDNTNTSSPTPSSTRSLDPAALAALMGGPSDADLMKANMSTITAPSETLPNKVTAFDNFEQLIESLDNANNLSALSLWTPLLDQLSSPEPQLRLMAAWCVGTAVQNNAPSQDRVLIMGGVERLLKMVLEDEDEKCRRKACYALSSAVRNFQGAMDRLVEVWPEGVVGEEGEKKVDAADMEAVDRVLGRLRERIQGKKEGS